MWHDQGEWFGYRKYCFWDLGKERVQISLFYVVLKIAHNSITRYPILTGFASTCSISEVPESGAKISILKIFDMWIISLDRVTYACHHGAVLILMYSFYNTGSTISKTAKGGYCSLWTSTLILLQWQVGSTYGTEVPT